MKFNVWSVFPLVIFLLLVGFFWRGLSLDPHHLPSVQIGKKIPNFQLPVLGDETQQLTQASVQGHMVLLNIWASWCEACTQEQHFLGHLARQGVVIYGINYKDDSQAALHWLSVWGNPYRLVGRDIQGQLAIDLGVYGAPESFLVDAQGMIRYRYAGILTETVWKKHFLPLIDKVSA